MIDEHVWRVPTPPLRPFVSWYTGYRQAGKETSSFARAAWNGAAVARELNDTDHGSRDFAVRDPEGNLWSFGTYRGHPR